VKRLIKFIILTLLFCFFSSLPSTAFASALNWTLSYPNTGESEFIKASKLNSKLVYASIRNNVGKDFIKTTDGGESWFHVNLPSNGEVNWISFNKDEDKIAISVWGEGIYLSNNAGSDWNKIFQTSSPRSVEFDPADSNHFLVGVGGTNGNPESGVFESKDLGASWSKMSTFGNQNSGQITWDPSNSARIFLGADPDFFKSLDNGLTWEKLNLHNVYSNLVIDNDFRQTLYSSQYDNNSGIYKSLDGGATWHLKISKPAFRLVQDKNGNLYATDYAGGGIRMSKDGAETWENVADPSWGSRNTWGMDVRDGRIYVSVEGLGIFYADTQQPPPPPPPKPNPIVFVPGMLGSWSSKALVLHQQTQPEDWILTPVFTDDLYRPVTETLKTTGLKENENLFVFPYDWRQNINFNAENLKNFLVNKVQPKNPNLKINLIGHSMGGMISSYCFEKVPDCTPLINKILTVGSPLKGALPAYRLWEGGSYQDSDPLMNILMSVALRIEGSPYLLKKDIVRQTMPGVKDLLPVFDYIQGRPYAQISSDGKNPILESLQNWSLDFKGKTHTFSSLQTNTDRTFQVTNPSNWESVLGLWTDGKPTSTLFESGDGTVLNSSSSISEIPNDNFPTKHANYFTRADVLSGVLNNFGLSGQPVVQIVDRTSFLAFLIHSPASIKIFDQNANQVGTNVDDSFVILKNPIPNSNYFVELTGTGNGEYVLESYFASGSGEVINQKIAGTISTNDKKTVSFKLSNDFSQTFVPANYEDYLIGFVKAISKVNDKNAELIKNRYVKAVKNTKNLTTWKQMRQDLIQSHYDLIRLLAKSRETLKRNAIIEADGYVINLNNYLHQKVYLHNKEEIVAEDDNGDLYKFLLPIFPDKKSYLIALNRSEAEIMRDLGKKYYQSGENFKARMYRRGSDLLQEGRF